MLMMIYNMHAVLVIVAEVDVVINNDDDNDYFLLP